MSPEYRAQELWRRLLDRGAGGYLSGLIADIIREAENDALERAAQVVDKQDPDCCYVNARDVRALKHPVE